MWDNREGKRNPKAPDFKCKDRGCDGVIWPPRDGRAAVGTPAGKAGVPGGSDRASQAAPQGGGGVDANGMPLCPVCGGAMWDNRVGKKNPKAPDYKCKDKGCDGVVWPPKATPVTVNHTMAGPGLEQRPPQLEGDGPDSDLPF